VAVCASYDAVVALLERQTMPAAVAPECDGWVTLVPLVHREHVVGDGDLSVADLPGVLAGELATVAVLLQMDRTGASALTVADVSGRSASVRLPGPGSVDVDPTALRRVGELLGADRAGAVAEVLAVHGRRPGASARLTQRDRGVVAALGLPPYLSDADLLGAPGDEREVLLVQTGQAEVRVAASALRTPLVTVPLGGGWRLVAGPNAGVPVLPALAGLASGRRVGVLLWRQGGAAGFVAARRGRAAEAHAWNPVWQVAGVDEQGRPPELVEEVRDFLAPPTADATRTARLLRIAEDDVVALRALLRRRGDSRRWLEEFAALAALPADAVGVLAGAVAPEQLPGALRVEPTGPVQAVWQAAARRQVLSPRGSTSQERS